MSGVDKICEKIIQDAREKAAEHIREAEEKATELIAGQERDAMKNREKKLEKAAKEAKNLKERMISIEKLESRKRILRLKQDIVSKAFEMAMERMAGLPDEEYRRIIVGMALPHIKDGSEEIIISGRDRKRLDGIDSDINRKLGDRGIKGSIKISEKTGSFLGGFIIKRGKIEINNTLETLKKANREKLEKEVAETLFN